MNLLDVALLPAQQVGPYLLVELLDLVGVSERAEVAVEVLERLEDRAVEEVEQCPQLGGVVLQWRAGEQVAVLVPG